MKVHLHIKRIDGLSEVEVGNAFIELKRDYLMEIAKDALSEDKWIHGPKWLEYLKEALETDLFMEIGFVDFFRTWTPEEQEELADFVTDTKQVTPTVTITEEFEKVKDKVLKGLEEDGSS